MAAPMEKTRYPGIFKRGSRYVVVYRAGGKQRKESVGTLREARALRASRQADVARGEWHEATTLTFNKYALEWVERYQGRGRGFRESTRDEYRRALVRYAIPFFTDRHRRTVSQITPRDIANFVAWLCDEKAQAQHDRELAARATADAIARSERRPPLHRPVDSKRFTDSTVRNIVNPVRACLRTAVAEGLIRHNPTLNLALPHRPVVDDDSEDVRPFTREQLAILLALVPTRHSLMFQVLAVTGLRISELIALQWKHLRLNGSQPHVAVRRAIVRGRVQPPKTRHSRREVPVSADLVSALRALHATTEWPGDDHLVFPSLRGTAFEPRNLRRRALAPAAEEAGVPWAGFHTFRHTCASLLFDQGRNAKQVQRWLGHHSASFTLDTYIHLLSDDIGEPLFLNEELAAADRPSRLAVT
jgi:integrase